LATLTLDSATLSVRPWPAGGAWNTVTVSNRVSRKTTTWGVTLTPGQADIAMLACNQFMNPPYGGTMDRLAQETLHSVGLEAKDAVTLEASKVGTGATANVLDRGTQSAPGFITIVTTVGATPTCTYQCEGSADNTSWAPLSTADSGTPTTFTTATFAITTATTTVRIIDPAATNARYVRVTLSANTNVTSTIEAAAS
jgi:hypothetical protein